jgi:lipopolysaccharide export system protein LptA
MKPQDRSFSARSRTGADGRIGATATVFVALWLLALGAPALAERADRNKPVTLEADRVEIDDQKKEAVFHGNVTLTQGTLTIKADRIVVKQDKDGFQSGVAYGKPAYFRQKREGVDEYIEGFAERLEYDSRAEKVEMFTRAQLKRGADEVRGDYISYNATTEFFQVVGGGTAAATPGNPQGRVRAIIQPRPREGQESPPPDPLPLRPAEPIDTPRQ